MRNRAREISGGLKSTTESTTRSVLEILKIRISMHRIEGLQLLLVIFEPELAWALPCLALNETAGVASVQPRLPLRFQRSAVLGHPRSERIMARRLEFRLNFLEHLLQEVIISFR